MANIAPYRLATGTVSGLKKRDSRPDGFADNTNYSNCRAVIANVNVINEIDSSETTPSYTATAYLAHLLLRETQPNAHAKAKEPNTLAHDKY